MKGGKEKQHTSIFVKKAYSEHFPGHNLLPSASWLFQFSRMFYTLFASGYFILPSILLFLGMNFNPPDWIAAYVNLTLHYLGGIIQKLFMRVSWNGNISYYITDLIYSYDAHGRVSVRCNKEPGH
jgi:hypothetical protein